MKRIVTIAIFAALLCGCVAQWPSHRTGPRWTSGPNVSPMENTAPSTSAGNSASGDPFGAVHGIGY